MFGKIETIQLDKLGLKEDDSIFLEPISDEQMFNVGCNMDAIRKADERIRESTDRFTYFGGDQIDAITPFDKRFNRDTEVEFDLHEQIMGWNDLHSELFKIHEQQRLESSKPYKCINEKVWGLLWGNHEYKIRDLTRLRIEGSFCKPNKIDFLGSRCIVGLRIKYKKKTLAEWRIGIMHGSGGGRPETMFRDMKKNWDCDAYICGHLHQKRFQPEIVYDFDWASGKPYARDIVMANAGTFQEPVTVDVDGYLDRKNGIEATGIGTITLEFNGYEGKINGHI
jgi:hypothetical protein